MIDPAASTAPAPQRDRLEERLEPLRRMIEEDPERLGNDQLMDQAWWVLVRTFGGPDEARRRLLRGYFVHRRQRDELLAVIAKLKAQKPVLGWVLSGEFTGNGNGRPRQLVYARPLGQASAAPECFERVDLPDADDDDRTGDPAPMPDPPFLGFIDPVHRAFFGPASDIPPPPLRAEILEVVASHPRTRFDGLAEIEVADATQERSFTVFAPADLARQVRRKMDEDGQTVRVRSESGIVTAICRSESREHEDWLEYLDVEGPSVFDLVLPSVLRREWASDAADLAEGQPVRVALIGPTGTGKTSAAERIGRDAWRLAARAGRDPAGIALIHVSGARVGSSFIHATERTIFRAFRRATSLSAKGYVVVVLFDEADALLGEMDGAEHAHNRSERLAAQQLLTGDDPVGIYLTLNVRRNSWLPAAIDRRFAKREYARVFRGQMAAVARFYADRCRGMLEALGMTAEEFGGAFADNLFSDERVVALVHTHSGRALPVRARDLHNCSPGKAEALTRQFARQLRRGTARGLGDLWGMLDREFRAPNLNERNLFELTFLRPPRDDGVRQVELLG